MTYTSGQLVEATDYNNFVGNVSNNGLNVIWSTGSGDKGWGQTNIANVSVGSTVTATNWATLVNRMGLAASHTNTTITARTAPVTGNLIAILNNVQTDLDNLTTNRGNSGGSGNSVTSWSGTISKTTATGSGQSAWSITFTNSITFPSADQARYFWNAGGIVVLSMNKSSTGTDNDPDWNTFSQSAGNFYITGRVNSANQTIGATTFTGFTRLGGSGTPTTYLNTYGWYTLVSGGAATEVFKIFNSVSPYTNQYIAISLARSDTVLTATTTWYDGGTVTVGATRNISGGTETTSPYVNYGTAPTVLMTAVEPQTGFLSNSWGTATIAGSVA